MQREERKTSSVGSTGRKEGRQALIKCSQLILSKEFSVVDAAATAMCTISQRNKVFFSEGYGTLSPKHMSISTAENIPTMP